MTTALPGILACLAAFTAILLICAASCADCADGGSTVWRDARTLTIEGRGWDDTREFYHRLPAKAESKVTANVWGLAGHSAGMVARFVTDSPEISARWKLTNSNLAMIHMPATGVSGVDLYVRRGGGWRWLAVGFPSGIESEAKLASGLSTEKREYALYLPLYNGVTAVEIGIAGGASIRAAPPRTRDIKPVVFYGTSITQGGCCSRPGGAYPATIGCRLDIPTTNLGFSGNGKCEPEVADLLAELEPSLYVVDCLPNMEAGQVDERVRYLLRTLKAARPGTPVVLVEQAAHQSALAQVPGQAAAKNVILEKLCGDSVDAWAGKLYYVRGSSLLGSDGEPTVDGIHPNDLGFQRMADALTPVVKQALDTSSGGR